MRFKPFNILEVLDEMNLSCENPRFCVYVHISPKGKRYVGITSQTPEKRWGNSGKGYIENKHFYAAIQRYGWDNFEHVIVASDLNLVEASELECSLIAEYDSMNPKYGYNQTTGGNWSRPSPEIRRKLSRIKRIQWKNPEFRAKVVYGNKIAIRPPHTLESNIKRSLSLKGRPAPMKGRHWTEEQKAKIRGRTPWNKDLTKDTHPSLMRTSTALTNRKFSAETKQKMSSSRRLLYRNGYSPKWINNGIDETYIDQNEPIPEGYQLGRLDTIYITDGQVTKKIKPDDFSKYQKLGWVRGKSDKVNQNISKSHQQYIWEYQNLQFSSASSLAEYLNSHGYPKIVASTITNLYLKGFETSKAYHSLAGKILRKDLNEN